MNTLIYARVSTEDQVEKYGLPLQLRACREYAESRGWTVIAEITDDGISGTVLERPGLRKARDLVAAGQVQVLLMFDVDRLSRELVHLLILKPEIEKHATLEFVTAKFEDSPSGRLFFGISGVIASYEREHTRERLMRGKQERARAGKVAGGRTCFGYRYVAAEGTLLPDEPRASAVRDIFTWFLAGQSIRSIALRLRASGVRTWTGRGWGHSSVRRILTNETYAGVAHYGTHRREGKLLRLRNPSERIALSVPPLISHTQWEYAQRKLAENPAPRGRSSTSYLLRGLLHCSACGRRMHGNSRRGHLSYRCIGRDSLVTGQPCTAKVNARLVDATVWRVLLDTCTDPANLRALLAEHQRDLREAGGAERLDAMERQLRQLRAREQRCLTLMLDEDLVSESGQLKARYLDAKRERASQEAALAGMRASESRAQSTEAWLEESTGLLREYLPAIENAEERQAAVRAMVTRAEIGNGELTMHCIFGPEMGRSSGRCEHSSHPQLTDSAPITFVVKARLAA